jgi:hypothetical protein
MCPEDLREAINEGAPIHPNEEREAPTFAQVRLVPHQRSMGSHDVTWHNELQHGMVCPQCTRYKLKQYRHTVYCHFCRQRWWSKKTVERPEVEMMR